MTDPTFRAKIRPELHPAAQELVDAYESVPGGKTYPCLPEGIAAVLDVIRLTLEDTDGGPCWSSRAIGRYAALLRGEEP